MVYYLAQKIEIIPDNVVKEIIIKNCNYRKYLWNIGLNWRRRQERFYESKGKRAPLKRNDFGKYLRSKDRCWREFESDPAIIKRVIDSVSRELEEAYIRYFTNPKHFRKPHFKLLKYKKMSFTIDNSNKHVKFGGDIRSYGKYLIFPKIRRNQRTGEPKDKCLLKEEIRYFGENSRILYATFRIEHERYYVILLHEVDQDYFDKTISEKCVGIDLGVRNLATLVDTKNNVYIEKQITKLHNIYSKIRYIQSKISKLECGSNNYKKAVRKLHDLWIKYNNIKNNQLHQLTAMISKTYSVVCIEDLDITKMKKQNKELFRRNMNLQLNMSSFYTIRQMLTYKCIYRGSKLIVVDRFFPSTQMCYDCGNVKTTYNKLSLEDRVYMCDICGYIEDRDINAAKNILREGISNN